MEHTNSNLFAAMPETNFDKLLHRYLHDELSPEENLKFKAWLDLLERENAGDLELSSEAQDALYKRITNRLSSVDDVIALYPRHAGTQRFYSQRWIQVAAAVLLLIVGAYGIRYLGNANEGHTAIVDKKILDDGTLVWINGDGNFNYHENGGGRFAEFEGEALFEVAKDPDRPFVISLGSVKVKVVGTSFRLKTNSGLVELDVLTGHVKVTSDKDKTGVEVKPNERIIYATSGIVNRSVIKIEDIENIVANTEYNMKFKATSMADVIQSIEAKFNVEMEVTNKALLGCHISADFTDQSLEKTLSILTDLLDVSYNISGTRIQLSGPGC
ncbi:MAG: FecR domain-containing protein [Chryseolinea sp.]